MIAVFLEEEGIKLPNTDEETLLPLKNPRADKIVVFRKRKKLGERITGLLKKVWNGRIHSEFNPLGAIHGRFTSKKTNLQNIDKGELRTCFVPSAPDRLLITADYGQIELRAAAVLVKEPVMIEAFRKGSDLHAAIVAANKGIPVGQVEKKDRNTMGKACNFGFTYGMSKPETFVSYALANWGFVVDIEGAQRCRGTFFQMYPGIKRWHGECWRMVERPEQYPSARTVMGRLLLPKTGKPWSRFAMFTEYVVSGSCADLLKLAMVRIAGVLPDSAHLVATVHDELVYDAPADIATQCRDIIQQVMIEAFVELFGEIIPVEVEAKVVLNWGEK